jgi:NTE family protein
MLRRTRRVFGSLAIEDLALPFFCIATDISRFGMLVIDRGSVTDAVMASSCLPGIFPPVNINGRWAVDGALVNAVPVDVMRGLVGPSGVVIASDVSAGGTAPLVQAALGASGASGWKQLLRTLQGRRAHPFIADIMQRAATAAGDHQLQRSMATGYPDLCIRHDTLGYSVIDFSKPAPLREKGYATSMDSLRPLLASGSLKGIVSTG